VLVNQEVLELRLMLSKLIGWLGSGRRDTPMHTRGYSCSASASIWNTFRGLGSGKSKFWNTQTHTHTHTGQGSMVL